MKILITEFMWESGINELKQQGFQVDYDKQIGKDKKRLLSVIGDYHGLIVRNETKVNQELLEKAKKLSVVGRLGVGLDNIDLQSAQKKNIPIVTAKNANATSVAEYVMAAMLDASRNIHASSKDVHNGNWDRVKFTGAELHGKTLGLFGLGEISQRVANRATAFGMDLIGYDPFITPYDHILAETGVEWTDSMEYFLTNSDFISIHVPLTDTTKDTFNEHAFSIMKETSYIINTARGGIINEVDLAKAVNSGEIKGAYLDVLESEPIPSHSALHSVPSIQITPHIAGVTMESQNRISILVAQEVSKTLEGKHSLCLV